MLNIHDVADYIIVRTNEAGLKLTHQFLQKILYYCQAWNLGLNHEPLFDGKFEAWVFGPVNIEIDNRFDTGSTFNIVTLNNIRKDFKFELIPEKSRTLINEVLEEYGKFANSQLVDIVRSEKPWLTARKGYARAGKCGVEIDEELMRKQFSDSVLPINQIDFYMRRDEPDLCSALIKCAEDLEKEGVEIYHGWRICDLLKEAALNIKELKE